MRIARLMLPLAFAYVAGACHHPAPPVAVQPQVDSAALARARQDSIARAEAQERALAQHRADSLAALSRQSHELEAKLASLIHFDYNKAILRPGDEQILDQKVAILLKNPGVRIQVAGNCDERGSEEYNLALGNRRAITAKQYLVAHGIDASRIEAISNGKEHPIDPDHTPEAWAQNRNDQFAVLTLNVELQP
jgi:peptidoglycan-associated lipoprotein